MAEYYFQTRGMCVGYSGNVLIRDITVDVEKGEIVTLIGPNGSGKSTILKSITKQLQTIAGTVYIDGQDLASLHYRTLATKMSVVLTERMKPELLTCRDIVSTGRYPYTGRLGFLTEEDDEKVKSAMENVHVLELADRDFNAISDGQRQRVLLARAICQEPELIILDEPTSFLDIRHKLELLGILLSMAKENDITVIMSLHEIDLAQKVSDKILCVKGDTIYRYGTPDIVFDEQTISELYELEKGCYDPLFGSVELPRPEGEPQVLVVSSGGRGIPVYRKLQKENIPFCAGILYTNDVDYSVARSLACEVISERPFFPISESALDKALKMVSECRYVIDAGVDIGETNSRIAKVLDAARAAGKLHRETDSIER